MADRGTVHVTGVRELRAALKKAGLDTQNLKDAHEKVSVLVIRAATFSVPRRSGKLAGSMRAGTAANRAVARAGGAAVPYANPIHWGWPSRPNTSKGWRGGPIARHAFLWDAAHATKPAWLAVYEKALEKITAEIAAAVNGAQAR